MRDHDEILTAGVRVPEHVVHRDFPDESVVLNLDSGMYHGLNATAAKVLAELESSSSVAAAIERLAAEFGQPRELVERDVLSLCRSLAERGLIQYVRDPS
jgi:hypothetical protein